MNLTEAEIRILVQALIHLQIAIARKREYICTELEAEHVKEKLVGKLP